MSGAVAAVVLAAGGGRRFGRPKALVELDGEALVTRAVGLAREAGCAPVVAVVGAAAEQVAALAATAGAETVENPAWRSGMASSLERGLAALEGRAAAAVVLLVDQPWVGDEAVRRLVRAWEGGALAAVATYAGEPRNPVLLDRRVWAALRAELEGDRGAGPFLARHRKLVTAVACDGTGTPADVDTPADLHAT